MNSCPWVSPHRRSLCFFGDFQLSGGARWKEAAGRQLHAAESSCSCSCSATPGEPNAAGMSQGGEAWQAGGLSSAPCQADSPQVSSPAESGRGKSRVRQRGLHPRSDLPHPERGRSPRLIPGRGWDAAEPSLCPTGTRGRLLLPSSCLLASPRPR